MTQTSEASKKIILSFSPPLEFDNIEDVRTWIKDTVTQYKKASWIEATTFPFGSESRPTIYNIDDEKYPLKKENLYKDIIHEVINFLSDIGSFLEVPEIDTEKLNYVCIEADKKGIIHARSIEFIFIVNVLDGKNTHKKATVFFDYILLFQEYRKKTFPISNLYTIYNDGNLNKLENLIFKYESLIKEIEEKRVTIADSLDIQCGILTDRMQKIYEGLDSKVQDYDYEIQKMKEKYAGEIATAEQVAQWENLSEKYTTHAYWARWVIGCSMISFAVLLCVYGYYIANSKIPLLGLGPGLVLVSIAIWAIRLTVKYYVSRLHLSTDARERATMTKTYLALIATPGTITDVERQIFFSTLFRPSTSGLIKEDGIQTPADVLAAISRHTVENTK